MPADSIAERELRHVLDFNADQPLGQMQKGAYELTRNNLPAAVAHYERAYCYFRLDDFENAAKDAGAAVHRDPKLVEAHYLGTCCNAIGTR